MEDHQDASPEQEVAQAESLDVSPEQEVTQAASPEVSPEAEPAQVEPEAASPEPEAAQTGAQEASSEPEVAEAGGSDLFAGLLEESLAQSSHRRGDIVKGVVVRKQDGEILVDIGAKAEAVIAKRELERMSDAERDEIKVGDELTAYVVNPSGEFGNPVLSLRRAQMESDWTDAQALMESSEVIERQIVGYNKGGVIVRLGKVRGFIPASQLSSESRRAMTSEEGSEDPPFASLVDRTVSLKVIEVDRRRNRLILSEREAMRESRKRAKERLLDSLAEGETRAGVVSSLCAFGAFVDLGGADGLIHISELSWGRVSDPSEVVKVGQEVEVQVLKVDRGRNRIALSLKRLEAEPWSAVDKTFYVGQLVEGTITKLTDFGAFARLNGPIEGLIHISELSEDRINHPRDVVSEGQEVTLRVIRIDSAKRRMGLSLRRAQDQGGGAEDFDDFDDYA